MLNANFTFQSGYIQIKMKNKKKDKELPLHSNLVIFKSVSYNTIYSSHFKHHFCLPIYLQVQNYYGW